MKDQVQRYGAIFGIAVLVSQIATAETTLNQSQVSSISIYEKISEKFSLNYWGIYRGATVSSPMNSLQPKYNGTPDPANPQGIESILTTAYKINRDVSAGVLTHFSYFPVGYPAGTGSDIQMFDPMLVVSKMNIINQSGFRLGGRVTAHIPLTSADVQKPDHLLTAITPTLITSYDIPNTRLTIGTFAYLRGYIPGSGADDTVRTYKVYIAPNANYQLSQTVAATLWVDLVQATRFGGTGFLAGMDNAPVDVQPGINWDITKNISLNPVINIYPGNMTLAATSIQAYIIARAF